MRRFATLVLAVTAAFAAAARADLDVTIANGDTVRGTLLPANETETFRVACPAGAKLSATLRSGPARSRVVLRLLDASGTELASSGGRASAIRGHVVATSGEHRLVVESQDGVTSDDYQLAVSWKSPRRVAKTVFVNAASVAEFRFSAEAGADVSLALTPSRHSHVLPSVVRVTGSQGLGVDLSGGPKAVFHAPATDTYTLTFENTAALEGDVQASAKLQTAKAGKRLLSATTRDIPPGADVVAAVVMDTAGGRIDAPAQSVLAGTSVTVPRTALAVPTIVVLGTTADLAPPKPAESVAATRAAFVGPFLRAFPGLSRPNVDLSYSNGPAPLANAGLRVFAADSAGVAQEIAGAKLDAPSLSVSFEAAQFTRFQGFFVQQPDVTPPFLAVDVAAEDLGASVAASGTFVFVGAPSANGTGGQAQAGAVRVFEHVGTTWIERARIQNPTPEVGDRFGGWIAVKRGGDGLLRLFAPVSSKTAGGYPEQGVIHVFAGDGVIWNLESSLTPPPADAVSASIGSLATYGRFGGAATPYPGVTIAADGDSFVASATLRWGAAGGPYSYDTPTSHYVCSRKAAGWSIDSHALGAAPHGMRGTEWLAFSSTGDPWHQVELIGVYSGGAYADAGGASTLVQSLNEPAPGGPVDGFGQRLVVDGDTLATSTWGNANHGRMWFGSRSASGWTIDQRVDPLVTSDSAWNGTPASIALQGDNAVATAANQASATVYRRVAGAWSEALRLDPTAVLGGTHNDSCVALDGRVVVIGARNGPPASRGFAIYLLPW